MKPTFDTVYSPDDGGYYCTFWDKETGKNLFINGRLLETRVYAQRHRANKIAKRILRNLFKKQAKLVFSGLVTLEQ